MFILLKSLAPNRVGAIPLPDEDWQNGYHHEFQDFMESIYHDREPLSGAELGRDSIAVLYSAYLSAERHGAEVAIPAAA